jgi:hypothetical protein
MMWLHPLDRGGRALRARSLDHYLDELRSVRQLTLGGLAARDDAWLERSVGPAPRINVHWAWFWFHVAEDEINHRGQIRWLRARLPSRRVGGELDTDHLRD